MGGVPMGGVPIERGHLKQATRGEGTTVETATFDEVHDHHPELTLELAGDVAIEWDTEAGAGQPGPAGERHGARAVEQAMTQRGVRESGGANAGIPLQRYTRYFVPGSGPLPWCAFFVSWCFDTTGDKNHRVPWGNAGYVGAIHAWARQTGRLVTVPRHGDIFGVGTEHTGLVAGANPDRGVIWTIEGNYGDAVGQRNMNFRSAGLWFARLG